ncbi:hypothetical protein BC829DRAFT_22298 [Chytridium lagenaria]|nr:hypothetical protein BC829DRAFT_22298 [Chytridium lagenaria]
MERIEAEREVRRLKETVGLPVEGTRNGGRLEGGLKAAKASDLYALGRVYETGDAVMNGYGDIGDEDCGDVDDCDMPLVRSKMRRLVSSVVPVDLDVARRLYERSATLGHAGAQYQLGMLILTQRGGGQSRSPPGWLTDEGEHADGVEWLRRAAKQGHRGALESLSKGRFGWAVQPRCSQLSQANHPASEVACVNTLHQLEDALLTVDRLHEPGTDIARLLESPSVAKEFNEACGKALNVLASAFELPSNLDSKTADTSLNIEDHHAVLSHYAHTTIGRRVIAATGLATTAFLSLAIASKRPDNSSPTSDSHNRAYRDWTDAMELIEGACSLAFPKPILAWSTSMLEASLQDKSSHSPDIRFFLATATTLTVPGFLNRVYSAFGDPQAQFTSSALVPPPVELIRALVHIDLCLEARPNHCTYLRVRGQLRTAAGRYREAVRDFSQLLKIKSGREAHGTFHDRGCAALLLQLKVDELVKRTPSSSPMGASFAGGRRRTSSSSLAVPVTISLLQVPKTDLATAVKIVPPKSILAAPIDDFSFPASAPIVGRSRRSASVSIPMSEFVSASSRPFPGIHSGASPSTPLSPSYAFTPPSARSPASRALEDFETFFEFASPEDGRVPETLHGWLCAIVS